MLNAENKINTKRRRPIFSIDREIKAALQMIYDQNEDMRRDVAELVNLLLPGGREFWVLKDVLKNEEKL